MENENIVFIEEYKKLDNYLKDRYSSDEEGVTAYINDMEDSHYKSIYHDYFYKLIRLRSIRNRLTHDNNTFYEDTATEDDIDDVIRIYKQMKEGKDPLYLARHKTTSQNTDSSLKERSYKIEPSKSTNYSSSDHDDNGLVIFLKGFLIVILLASIFVFTAFCFIKAFIF